MLLLFVFMMCLAMGLHLSPVDPLEPDREPESAGGVLTTEGCSPPRPPRAPCQVCAAARETGPCVHDSNGRTPGEDGWEPSGPTLYGRLAPVALLVLGLLAPGVAHADIGGAVGGLVLDKLVLPIVLGLTAAGFAYLGRLIINHMAPGRVRDALLILDDAAAHGVAFVEQMIVPALRNADGSLSGDAKARAAAAAQQAALDWLGSHGLETVQKVLGLDTPAVAAQLAPRIEAKVEESRKVQVVAPSGRVIVAPAAS